MGLKPDAAEGRMSPLLIVQALLCLLPGVGTIGLGALYALATLGGHGSDRGFLVACYNVATGVVTLGAAHGLLTCLHARQRRWVHRCVGALAAQCALPLLIVASELSAQMASSTPGLGRPRSDELAFGLGLLAFNTTLAITMELTTLER